MFYSLVAPFQHTCLVSFFLFWVLLFCLRKKKQGVVMAFLISFVMFIPLLIASSLVIDSVRYGEFQYDTALAVNDESVQLPDSATRITLHKYASSHAVRFRVEESALEKWMAQVTAERKQFAGATSFELIESGMDFKLGFLSDFEFVGWGYPDDVLFYRGWRSGRGAGFDVWYAPTDKLAYIRASYW